MYELRRQVGQFLNTEMGLYLPFQFNPMEILFNKETNYAIEEIPGLDQNAVIWTSGGPFTIEFEISFDARAAHVVPADFTLKKRNPFSAFTKFYFGDGGIKGMKNLLRLVPGGNRLLSRLNKLKNLTGIPLGEHNHLSDKIERYETLDGAPYEPNLGVLPHIAVLETFLRPKNLNFAGEADSFDALGSMKAQLTKAKSLNEKGSDQRFVAPPDLFFYYGTRLFKCKLQSAPINETIHNTALVPTRCTVSISLIVLEMSSIFEEEDLNRSVLSMSFNNRLVNEVLETDTITL